MRTYFGIFFLHLAFLSAEEESTTTLSEAMGHLIGKNLQSLGFPLDMKALAKGLQDEASGKKSPLSEEECLQALSILQEQAQSKMAKENLQQAEDFLKKHKKEKGVVLLEEGKIQYEVLKKGEGAIVSPYATPLVRYTGYALNHPVSPEVEEMIDLDGAILGLKEALIGMKTGEKRKVYIHPSFGYGEDLSNDCPNALLIFEIEVIKADASIEAHAASELPDFGINPASVLGERN